MLKSFLSLFLCQVSPSLDNFDTVDRIQKKIWTDVCFRINRIRKTEKKKTSSSCPSLSFKKQLKPYN